MAAPSLLAGWIWEREDTDAVANFGERGDGLIDFFAMFEAIGDDEMLAACEGLVLDGVEAAAEESMAGGRGDDGYGIPGKHLVSAFFLFT